MCKRGHKEGENASQCKFTPDSSLCRTTVWNLVKTYTGNDIKKLSGLDNTRILKGRDNFDRAKRVVGELCTPEMLGLTDEAAISALKEEAIGMKKRIDNAELFYRIEFPAHVQSEAGYSCCCF